MEQIVVKTNGETVTMSFDKEKTTHYINEKDNCFSNIIDYNNVKKNSNADIALISSIINTVIRDIVSLDKNNTHLEVAMTQIQGAKTKEDLITIVIGLLQNKDIDALASYQIQESMENNLDLVLSITVKSIVKHYISHFLLKLSKPELITLYKMREEKRPVSELLKYLKIKFGKNAKKQGVDTLCENVLLSLLNSKNRILSVIKVAPGSLSHKCGECLYARANMCLKVAHRSKRKINEYPFITDGYQIIDINDRVDKFIVSKCNDYECELKSDNPELRRKQREKAEATRALPIDDEFLKNLYKDADIISEEEDSWYNEISNGVKSLK